MENSQDTRPTFIYVLKDPRTGEVRYVGKTVQKLKCRLANHLYTNENNHRGRWIRSVLSEGLEPIIELIETVSPDGDWVEREKYWIKWHRDNGYDLVNATDGGEGNPGWIPSEESKGKNRQSNLGRKPSQFCRERTRETQLGKKRSPETREKQGKGKMKPVAQYTCEGKLIKMWESAITVERELKILKSGISFCARARKGVAYGYQWRYWEDTQGADIEPYVHEISKPVAQYSLDGEFIKEWVSAAEAGRAFGVGISTFSGCARARAKGKNRISHGFIWEFVVK